MSEPTFQLHPATQDDKQTLVDLVRSADVESIGASNYDLGEVDYMYTMTGFDAGRDIRIARDAVSGQAVGFGMVFAIRAVPVRPWGWGWTHPDHRNRGVGSALVEWMLERAKFSETLVPPEARIVLEVGASENIPSAYELLASHGFVTERAAYTMKIDFETAPEAPELPDGLRLVTFAERPDVELFARARKAGFADHRGAVDEPIEAVIERTRKDTESGDFNPNLWFLAMDGDEPAGLAYNSFEDDEYPDVGYVASLAVLPAYRKRGLAYALLKRSFVALHALGRQSVTLGVDGSSLTGAVRLYERAGMYIRHRTFVYEREVRAGVEISKQD